MVAGTLAGVTLDRSEQLRDAYALTTSRIVSGGQRAAAQLAIAYVGSYVRPVRPPDVSRALTGMLITPGDDGAIVGLLRLWSLLDEGVQEAQARSEAGQLAGGFAQQNVRSAMSAGLDEGAGAADREPRWRLEPNPGACAWCQYIAETGARYLSADSVPVPHGTPSGGPCGCSPAPEF